MRSMKKVVTQGTAALVVCTQALLVALAAPAPPQEQEPSQQQPSAQGPVIKSQVNLVNLFATVRDKSKRIMADLKKEDFKIYEDNQEQKVAFFSKEVSMPITLALLLDTSGSEQYMLGAIQEGAMGFLSRVMRKGDEALVMSFDLDVDLLSDFTDDRAQLDRAIRRAKINAGGPMVTPGTIPTRGAIGTDFYDAVYLACGDKLSTEAAWSLRTLWITGVRSE